MKKGFGLATLAATALSLGIGGTATASPVELVRGSVKAPGGAAASSMATGTVNVFLDTTDRGPAGPRTLRMKSLAVAPVQGGRFRVLAEPSRAIARAARANGGYANFLLMAKTTAGESIFSFSRRIGANRAWASGTAKPARVPLLAYERGERPSWLALASQAPERADCEWKRSRTYYRYTRVGELHQWDGFRSTFYYATGSQADTDFWLAISRNNEAFRLAGEYHVSKTRSHGSVMPAAKGRFARYMQTRFSYFKLYIEGKDCTRSIEVVRARRHEGGSYYKPHDDAARVLDGRCHKVDPAHRLTVVGHGTEWTEGGEARRITKAVSVVGAGIATQSGWSKNVRTSWHNAGDAMRAICSVYETPNFAPVTYVGGIVRN